MASPVTSSDLAGLLGRPVTEEQGNAVISVVTSMLKAYVRGGPGWTLNEEQRAVVLSASARLISHARQVSMEEAKGPESVSYRSAFTGWTPAELYVLDRSRIRAMS
jgi:hypothetical protein